MVGFHDNSGWDYSRLFLWPIDASTWIILPPDGDKYAEKCSDYSKMRAPLIGDDGTPEADSVELSRDWTIDELSEMVREGRNLALGAQTLMGLTFDNVPSMMCDLSGPVLLADRVKRRIVRKLPEWRPSPVHPSALLHHPETAVNTSHERRVSRRLTPQL